MNRSVILIPFIIPLSSFLSMPCAAERAARIEEYEATRSPSGFCIIHHPPSLTPMAREVERILEESAPGIAREIGLERIDTIRVYLAPDGKRYELLHEGKIPEWGVAFSDLASQEIGIHAEAVLLSPRPLETVIRHELSHLLLAQRAGNVIMPNWFMEGLAMRQAREWTFSDGWKLFSLMWKRELPYLESLEGAFPRRAEEAAVSYGLSYLAVEELLRESPEALVTLTAFMRDRGDFEDAFILTFGESPYDFASRFYVIMSKRYKRPAVLLHAAPYWLLAALLFIAIYVVKRMRTRRKLEEWERGRSGPSFN